MITIVLIIHLILAISMVGTVLLQKSEGGALGIGGGGGGGGMGGLLTARGSANVLTRATAILAACFMATSLILAVLAGSGKPERSIMETTKPAATLPAPPPKPSGPTVPLSK